MSGVMQHSMRELNIASARQKKKTYGDSENRTVGHLTVTSPSRSQYAQCPRKKLQYIITHNYQKRTSKMQFQGTHQSAVTPIGERRNDQSKRIAEIFVAVRELRVDDTHLQDTVLPIIPTTLSKSRNWTSGDNIHLQRRNRLSNNLNA